MADPLGCVKEIGKCIPWPHVKRHFYYWWCFDNNIQGLKDAVRDLDREMLDMNQKIEDARFCAEILRPGVEDWSNAGTENLAEARRILQDDNILKAWNLISRYSRGKSAKETVKLGSNSAEVTGGYWKCNKSVHVLLNSESKKEAPNCKEGNYQLQHRGDGRTHPDNKFSI